MNNAGLPGLGLGGLFYFLSMIAMVLVEVWRIITGRSTRVNVVARLLFITLLSIAVMYATYWGIDQVLLNTAGSGAEVLAKSAAKQSKPIVATFGILFGLLIILRIVGVFLPKPNAVKQAVK